MRCLYPVLIATMLCCGVSTAQEMPSNYEHLKSYEARIGEWVLDGNIQENIEGLMKEGDKLVARMTAKWILNKNAIATEFHVRIVESGLEYESKGMIGWNAGKSIIVAGSLDSFGGADESRIHYDAETKTWTSTNRGCDGEGRDKSAKLIVRLVDADTLEVQSVDRIGGFAQGDSPKYLYKRVK